MILKKNRDVFSMVERTVRIQGREIVLELRESPEGMTSVDVDGGVCRIAAPGLDCEDVSHVSGGREVDPSAWNAPEFVFLKIGLFRTVV